VISLVPVKREDKEKEKKKDSKVCDFVRDECVTVYVGCKESRRRYSQNEHFGSEKEARANRLTNITTVRKVFARSTHQHHIRQVGRATITTTTNTTAGTTRRTTER
jgi:hypothetical protein